jgi:WD40 repeat protein
MRSVFGAVLVVVVVLSLAASPAAAQEKPLTDNYGDPLPKGALQRLGTVRYRQNAPIDSFAFAPDGKIYATAANTPKEPTVRLWTTATGKEIRRCAAPDKIRQVLFAPDGKTVAAACGTDLVFWDAATGKKLRQFVGHRFGITCFAWSQDGKSIAAAGARESLKQYTICLIDAESGKPIREFGGHDTAIGVIAFSRDGKRLATSSADQSGGAFVVSVWDTATGQELHHLALSHIVWGKPTIDPHATRVATDRMDEKGDEYLDMWEIASGKKLWSRKVDALYSHAFSPNGDALVLSMGQGTIELCDPTSGKLLRGFAADGVIGVITGLDATGTLLATTAGTHTAIVRVRDLKSGQAISNQDGHSDWIVKVMAGANGATVVTASMDRTVRLWQSSSTTTLAIIREQSVLNLSADVSADGKILATTDRSKKKVRLVELPSGKDKYAPVTDSAEMMWRFALSPDGKQLITHYRNKPYFPDPTVPKQDRYDTKSRKITDDNCLKVWDLATGKHVRSLSCDEDWVLGVVFSPDGVGLLTWGHNLVFYGTRKGTELWWLPVRSYNVVFSVDGCWLVTHGDALGKNNTVRSRFRIWEVATAQLIGELDEIVEGNLLAIAPDGRTLIVGGGASDSGAILFWDLQTGKLAGRVDGHLSHVGTAAFSADGRVLVTGSTDGTALVWDVKQLPLAKPLPPRKFTANQLADLWADLASSNAQSAYQAIVTLTCGGKDTIAFLQDRLIPAKRLPAHEMAQAIADLDDKSFAVRDKAMGLLLTQGDYGAGELRKHLKDGISLEKRNRLELLLAKLDHFAPPLPELRQLRALTVLQRIGGTQARKLLETLATGEPEARLTQQARATLARLGKT